jgi:feruloyl esterase
MKPAFALLIAGLMALGAPETVRAQPKSAAPPCENLAGLRIEPTAIGLPTKGGAIAAAAPAATKTGVGYCLVSGRISPIDPQAPDIRFQVALPPAWNGKAVMLGGGGFNGVIPDVAGAPFNAAGSSPLERGYAVFASDSGHQSPMGGADGRFMTNDEAYKNWLGEALKKTRDAAMVVIVRAYGRAPTRAYFLGGSTGGREGLRVAALWPADWDGVVALYPARDPTALAMKLLVDTQAFAAPGAFLTPGQRVLLHQAALEACDGLDGVADGLISNVKGCYAVFDPARAVIGGQPLRCADGAAHGDACLSDVQLAAIRTMESPLRFGFPLASGETGHPGYNVLTADTGVPSPNPSQPFVSQLALGNAPPSFPANPKMALSAGFADNFVRFLVTRDPAANPLSFDIADPGPFRQRISGLSALDTPDKDLTGFAARGGKLLMLQGDDDLLISPRATEAYYEGLKARMGPETVHRFVRFYEVPGFGHAISTLFQASWDELGILEAWVEQGRDPGDGEVVADTAGAPGRTRPLCQYPAWPRYRGAGDVNDAASFVCATR